MEIKFIDSEGNEYQLNGLKFTDKEGNEYAPSEMELVDAENNSVCTFDALISDYINNALLNDVKLPEKPNRYAVASGEFLSMLCNPTKIKPEVSEKITALLNRKGKDKFSIAIVNNCIYSTLNAFDIAVLIALRVRLADQTPDLHNLIQTHRGKGNKVLRQGLHLGNPKQENKIIVEQSKFITKYLGLDGKQQNTRLRVIESLDKMHSLIFLLANGRFPEPNPEQRTKTHKVSELFHQHLLHYESTTFFYNGWERLYHIVTLHPLITLIFGASNYITYPQSNNAVLGAILKVKGNNIGLLRLYDYLLNQASKHYGKIKQKNDKTAIQILPLKEKQLFDLLGIDTNDKNRNTARNVKRAYSEASGINLFYKLGLLAESVKPPKENDKIFIVWNRIANG